MKNMFGCAPDSNASDLCSEWTAEEMHFKLFHEAKKTFVGYMPTNTFMQTFLPWHNVVAKPPKLVPFFPVYDGRRESEVYERFVRLASTYYHLNINSRQNPRSKPLTSWA